MKNYAPIDIVAKGVQFLSDIKPEKIDWLWPNRLALGKLTIVVGDPGIGKSFLSLDVAARLSTGIGWPDKPGVPGKVGSTVLITSEDDMGDTVVPRLIAAGADRTKICTFRGLTLKFEDKKEGFSFFDLKQGLIALDNMKRDIPDLTLVVLDPITAYMGNIDSHANADVRSVLDKLAGWAADNKVAIMAISHLNKNTAVGMQYRVMGSQAFTAVTRMVWNVRQDEEDADKKLLLLQKNNISPEKTGLAYKLKGIRIYEEGLEIDTAKIEWEEKTIDQQQSEEMMATEDSLKSTQKRATKWLKGILKDGPVLSDDIFAAARDEGLSETSVHKAKKVLMVKTKRAPGYGEEGKWEWEL
jgi:RecA-family ATPase